jgi:membrane-bound lytic murein transglycosylase MltF
MRNAIVVVLSLLIFGASGQAQALEDAEALSADIQAEWTGDYDAMLARRKIRVLIPYSKTFFFLDGGKRHGLAVEWLRAFEKQIQRDAKSKQDHPTIFLIPTQRDQLIPGLVNGHGDIAVANLTITGKRHQTVDFSTPFQSNISELVVTQGNVQSLAGPEALSGMEIHVRPSSSYFSSLEALNRVLKAKGKTAVKIVQADERLEDEDLLEMVNANLVPAIIIDSHKAAFWAEVFDNIKVHAEAQVRSGADIAWAFRKDSPKLKAKIDAFAATAAQGTLLGNILLRRYYKDVSWLKRATSEANTKRIRELSGHFKKYGAQYKIDWLLLAALAFRESGLKQSARGPTGAVGVMQIKPATAAGREVGIKNVAESAEANIHAGTKYIRYLADQYFPGKEVTDFNRILFALASYNAGPNRIAGLRKKTVNPNVWFDNVEFTVSKSVGLIPVRYVQSIYKYYISFRNFGVGLASRERAKGSIIE